MHSIGHCISPVLLFPWYHSTRSSMTGKHYGVRETVKTEEELCTIVQ